MKSILVDEQIELRLLQDEHAKMLFELVQNNRVYLREWLPWLDVNTKVEDTRRFIGFSKKQFEDKNGFQTGIWYKGQLCGVIGLLYINWGNSNAGIGYWMAEALQGKGIMTKSCKSLIDYLFDELELHRVEIRCAENNIKSRSIPERLGLKPEGLVREVEWLYDHYVNHVIYSVLASEWRKNKKQRIIHVQLGTR